MELVRKGESRCFVFKEEDIQKVYDTIREIDAFEFEYTPNNWVTVWNAGSKRSYVRTGKFDIDIPKLIEECGKKGFGIIVTSTTFDDHWNW